jgi:hypothetical protein
VIELDQRSATATADAPRHEPAGEQRPGSQDSQARYPPAVSAADNDPGYYDGDVQEALAADTTPTRQQAARDAGAHDQADVGNTDTSRRAAASGSDGDIEAILHENDSLAEPRSRQQAARDAAAGTSPAKQDSALATPGDQQPRSGPDPLTRTAGNDGPRTADLAAKDLPVSHVSPDLGKPESADRDQHVSVVQLEPEDRTLGDTTPTGIGVKPTGEQLLKMESDDPAERRINRFIDKAVEEADDVHDAMGHIGGAFQADFSPEASSPGPGSGHHSYTVHDSPAPPEDPGMSDAIGNVAVVAVVAAVGIRHMLTHLRRKGA